MRLALPGRGILRLDGESAQVFQSYLLPEERLADLLTGGEPVPINPLSEDELRLVQRALTETSGRMTQADMVSWGLAPRQARRLGQTWEVKGWLVQDPNRKNARYVTLALRQISEVVR